MLNRTILVGRLTSDITLRYTPSGKPVATGTVAVTRQFNREETDFINIVIWNKAAENTANFTKKGSLIGVDGRIQVRSYDTDNGKRYVTEVVAESVQFLDSKPKSENTPPPKQNTDEDPFADNGEPIDINDEDLPF
ncbi:single-strand DNA-binding protein [Bacillus oleivorans]|uniref:Single-stranded DNA-binding protein n=1 Tax=Bacillus oleivorans TaxID=1448271 RepID=A0A285D7T7_9BACI|nr:single-stranded DNA-binding protein [Bacillus oleivorans]SNX75870.1 single-strand DNA-binding protein [Bacillus oleivorans]